LGRNPPLAPLISFGEIRAGKIGRYPFVNLFGCAIIDVGVDNIFIL